jgi:hypothetical protein
MISKEQKRLEAIAVVATIAHRKDCVAELSLSSARQSKVWMVAVGAIYSNVRFVYESDTIDVAICLAEVWTVAGARTSVANHPELRDAFSAALRQMEEAKL